MAYSKQTWTNGVSKLNADRMNHIEDGIEAAATKADNIASGAEAANKAVNVQGGGTVDCNLLKVGGVTFDPTQYTAGGISGITLTAGSTSGTISTSDLATLVSADVTYIKLDGLIYIKGEIDATNKVLVFAAIDSADRGSIVNCITINNDSVSADYRKWNLTSIELAKVNGKYVSMSVGKADVADNLTAQLGSTDETPFASIRSSGGSADVGTGNAKLSKLVGATIAWNQLCENNDGWNAVTGGWYNHPTTTTKTFDSSTRTLTITANADMSGMSVSYVCGTKYAYQNNHKVLILAKVKSSINTTARLHIYGFNGSRYYTEYISLQANVEKEIFLLGSLTIAGQYQYVSVSADTTTTFTTGDTFIVRDLQVFNLTLMFGNDDRIPHALLNGVVENNVNISAATCFKRMFPASYYTHNVGQLISCKPSNYNIVGYNAFDGELEQGSLSAGSGLPFSDTKSFRTANFIPVIPNQKYSIETTNLSTSLYTAVFYCMYDENKNFIKREGTGQNINNVQITLPINCCFIKVVWYNSQADLPVPTEPKIAIHLTWSGSKTGYEAHYSQSYPLGGEELKGIILKDANNASYADGDTKTPDGTITRKYGSYAFTGSEAITVLPQYSETFIGISLPITPKQSSLGLFNKHGFKKGSISNLPVGYMYFYRNNMYFNIGTADSTALQSFVSGLTCIYELATPTAESGEAFAETTKIDDYGTQEIVNDSSVTIPVPVGNSFFYQINLQNFLQRIYQRVDGNSNEVAKSSDITSLASRVSAIENDMHSINLKTLFDIDASNWTSISDTDDIAALVSVFPTQNNFLNNKLNTITRIGMATISAGLISSYTSMITCCANQIQITVLHANVGSAQVFAIRYNSGSWQYKHI